MDLHPCHKVPVKYTALLLLLAAAYANANDENVYSNRCPKHWKVERLLPHPNCGKFYQCSNGQLVTQSCPLGLYFSIEENRCDWKSNVDCEDRIGNGGDIHTEEDEKQRGGGHSEPAEAPSICAKNKSDGILVAHNKCNRYYICNAGKPLTRKCPTNLFFNPKNDRCDWPRNVDCGNRTTSGKEDDSPNSDSSSSEDSGDGDNNSGAGNFDPSQAPSICSQKGSNGVLVAHGKCNKYYICANGIPVARPCPETLLFNPKTDKCDWPRYVHCGNRTTSDEEDDGSSNDSSGEDSSSSNSGSEDSGDGGNNSGARNFDPSQAPSICSQKGSTGVLVAHKKCNKYYICDNSKPISRPCPETLFFNPKTDKCDWPRNVYCGNRTTSDKEDDKSSNDSSGEDSSGPNSGSEDSGDGDNNSGAGNFDPSQAPSICSQKESNGVLVAHEKCNKYYICANGIPVARPCPGMLLFNPKTDKCDWPRNVHCGNRTTSDEEDDKSSNESSGEDSSSPNSGSEDSGDGGNNSGAGNFDPSQAPSICSQKGSTGVLVAHEKCNKYYICDNGKPISRPCPETLFFNPKTDKCDWPRNVDCGDRTTSDEENDNSSNDSSSEDSSSPNSSGHDSGDGDNNSGAGNFDPSQAPSICSKKGSNGVLVAHKKCTKYFICDNGKPVARPCPGTLLFNPKTDKCDWPRNVDCGNRTTSDEEDDNSSNDSSSQDSASEDSGEDDNNNGGDSSEDSNGGDNSGDNSSDGNNGGAENGAENCHPNDAPAICAKAGSDGVFAIHEKCNRFYICLNREPVAYDCPKNRFFDCKTYQCDLYENVNCKNRSIPINI